MLFENRNFCVQCWNFDFLLERENLLNVLHNIYIWISHVFHIFQNFLSYISMTLIQIFTDCSVLDRFCFCCIVCLFWWIYGSYRGVWVMEKLEYSSIMPILNFNQFTRVPKVKDLFVILTDLTRFLLSFVCWSFQVLGETTMDKGIRSGKSLSLGMPKAPQGNIQGRLKRLSLGMPRMASRLSSTIYR
jgi:hypothetical protein